VPTAAENGEYGVADGALQGASDKASVGPHVADFSFYGATASKICEQFRREAAACATDQDTGLVFTMAPVTATAGKVRSFQFACCQDPRPPRGGDGLW